MPLIQVGKKKLLPLLNLREAVLLLTYEPERLSSAMRDAVEYNMEEWLKHLEQSEKDNGIAGMDMFKEEKAQLAAIVGHYKRNIEGRYERRKWLCKHLGVNWQDFHKPRPGLSGLSL